MKNHQPQHCDVHLRQPCCVDCVSGASPNAQVAEPEKNEKEKKRNCFRHRGYITFLSNEGSSHLRHTRSRDVRGNAYTIGMFVDIVRWLFSFRFPNPKKKDNWYYPVSFSVKHDKRRTREVARKTGQARTSSRQLPLQSLIMGSSVECRTSSRRVPKRE